MPDTASKKDEAPGRMPREVLRGSTWLGRNPASPDESVGSAALAGQTVRKRTPLRAPELRMMTGGEGALNPAPANSQMSCLSENGQT